MIKLILAIKRKKEPNIHRIGNSRTKTNTIKLSFHKGNAKQNEIRNDLTNGVIHVQCKFCRLIR